LYNGGRGESKVSTREKNSSEEVIYSILVVDELDESSKEEK
jgi:hypothetical protein